MSAKGLFSLLRSRGMGSEGLPVRVENLSIEKKTDFILSKFHHDAILNLTTRLAIDQDSRVSRSHLIRAMCIIVKQYEGEIINEARALQLGSRPPNGSPDMRHAYETKIANAICRAIKVSTEGLEVKK